ncbi:MAG: hypothetical protein M3N19_02870 [Candidatus Eremiobacteraeota bacterium]|nr:hypothetical protein [Candidatus Eremiobacteraeota bacterium]
MATGTGAPKGIVNFELVTARAKVNFTNDDAHRVFLPFEELSVTAHQGILECATV